MGSGSSKVAKSGRHLSKAMPKSPATPSVNATRPDAEARKSEPQRNADDDASVAKRLQQIGPVQFRKMEEKYVPASEEAFAMTLEARKHIEEQDTANFEKSGPKKLLPGTTITAILRSLSEGESPESVARTYNLDASVLPKLKSLRLPERPKDDVGNQLLDESKPQQQPRRRKREPRK